VNLPSSDRLRNEGKSLLSGRFAPEASFGFQNPDQAAPDRWCARIGLKEKLAPSPDVGYSSRQIPKRQPGAGSHHDALC
jgi:hypothetical protein